MLSKRLIKYFKSLQLKKYRHQERKFIVEGAKGVSEVLASDFMIDFLLTTKAYAELLPTDQLSKIKEIIEVTENELKTVGTFQSNSAALAIVSMKDDINLVFPENKLVLALDDVRDPGNLGTIIRIADWYGIETIICSLESADVYNPKVINSSMGSFARVNVHYKDLKEVFTSTELAIYGALLSGENIYNSKLTNNGILLMGNESQGINSDLEKYITHSLHIPRRGGAESLNVAIATAVILDNFFR
ncbi:RNA methyltransferase [Roseivirga echinicomitans]|uniref:RNA methyltransferase n=1 Tax=Roseivirga echinicomitans TaxID=296218 RepID=A0A150XNE8_9BACT|nr:RNA methyltransferase [Roseivirga echinicomitans]KYG80234.1 RNA methyltransferase [Roseivirga echinicomitans]